jgi:AP-3 complex subunit beta
MALGAKLSLANPSQTAGIFQYILNLAKYDVNYDIRDRARVMRAILLNSKGTTNSFTQHARLLFFTPKPVPQVASQSKGMCCAQWVCSQPTNQLTDQSIDRLICV